MKEYTVDCWDIKKSTVQVGDTAYVEGQTSWFGNGTLIKADKIVNKTRNGPACECGEPDLNTKMKIGEAETSLKTKIFTKDIKKTGVVTKVTETEDGFWFKMDVDE